MDLVSIGYSLSTIANIVLIASLLKLNSLNKQARAETRRQRALAYNYRRLAFIEKDCRKHPSTAQQHDLERATIAKHVDQLLERGRTNTTKE